ncbi:hypothetical protein CEB3_c06690 [Peptococcaceae bacterium CEB3]|nr:hypothetical protein CEB3_c06690 [Peptococcaceae bacterium CEB3]
MKWTVAALALTLVVGCSSLSNPVASTVSTPGQTANTTTHQNQNANNLSRQKSSTSTTPAAVSSGSGSNSATPISDASASQSTDPKALLLNMVQLAKQFRLINSDFPAKAYNIEEIVKLWGKPDQETIVPAAKGVYATYLNHHVVFGFNKGNAIFEIRSYGSRLKSISLNTVKAVLGTPAYDTTFDGQEIIGYPVQQNYKAGTVFPQRSGSEIIPRPPQYKIEMVFPQPTASNPNPLMDHYNVLNPQSTGDQMGGDPGRQW